MTRHLRMPIAVLSLALASCAGLQDLARTAFERPRLAFRSAAVEGLDLEGATVALRFDLENPNGFGLDLARVGYGLEVEGTRIATGDLPGGLAIPARGTAPLTVPVRVRFADVPGIVSLLTGGRDQIRYRVAESNLYAYMFGVKLPISHVMGYFVSVLRERIASFVAPNANEEGIGGLSGVSGVSINDLRKNLRDLNDHMERECASSTARYGIILDASLITGIDPPPEVESALAAINTAHNQVSSDISLAQAAADQKIVQSKRAVEIETLNAQAEVEPLVALAEQLAALQKSGQGALQAYLRNVRLKLYNRAQQIIREVE